MTVADYLIVAWAAPGLRRLRLGFGQLSEQRLVDCRRVGRGDSLEPRALAGAMEAAATFWMVTMTSIIMVLFAVLLLIGSIFGHHAVGTAMPVFGALLGVFAFAGGSYGFAIVRAMFLFDGLIAPRGPAWTRRWSTAASTPRFRDCVISLAAGVVVAVISSIIMLRM